MKMTSITLDLQIISFLKNKNSQKTKLSQSQELTDRKS